MDNSIYYNHDGMKLLAYDEKTSVILWGAVQEIINEKDELLEVVKTMKKRNCNGERRDNKVEEEEG